jgi:hypothetical protein
MMQTRVKTTTMPLATAADNLRNIKLHDSLDEGAQTDGGFGTFGGGDDGEQLAQAV